MAVDKGIQSLKSVTSDFTHIYFLKKPIESNSSDVSQPGKDGSLGDCENPDFEFPVIADSVEYNVGEGHEEVKLISGETWAMKRSVESSVSFNVAANNIDLVQLFSGNYSQTAISGIKTPTNSTAVNVAGFNTAAMKSIEGALIMTDDAGFVEILPKVKITVTRGKDSLVYWTVNATVMANKAGFDVYVTTGTGS